MIEKVCSIKIYFISQMALLLLFEKSDNLSYKELQATTKMAEDQFPRYVQSLLEAKLLNCNTEVNFRFVFTFGRRISSFRFFFVVDRLFY